MGVHENYQESLGDKGAGVSTPPPAQDWGHTLHACSFQQLPPEIQEGRQRVKQGAVGTEAGE